MPDPQLLLTILDFLAYLLLCHVIGCALLIAVRLNVRGVVAPYPLLGSAALGIQLWAYGFAHIPWNALTLLLPWVAASAVLRRQLRETLRAQLAAARSALRRLPGIDPLIGGLVAVSILLVATYALNLFLHPVISWDGVAFWLIKAKLFFVDQYVDPGSSTLASIPQLSVVRNQDYPPLYPLMLASTWVLSGSVNEALGNSINLLCLIAVVPTMYSVLRQLVGPRLTVSLVFLFVALPAAGPFLVDGSYFGYADYVEACWLVLALLYLQAGARGGAADVMAVACAAGAALTKNEGIPLLLFVLAVLIVRRAWQWRRQRVLPARRNVVIAAACVLPVVIWQFTWQLPGTITPLMLNPDPLSLLPDLPSRAATIVRIVVQYPARNNTDFWLVLAVPLCLVLLAFNRFRTGRTLAAAFLLQLLAFFAVYLFTPINLVTHLLQSADRVILQLAPAVVLLLGVSMSPYVGPVSREPFAATSVLKPDPPGQGDP